MGTVHYAVMYKHRRQDRGGGGAMYKSVRNVKCRMSYTINYVYMIACVQVLLAQ